MKIALVEPKPPINVYFFLTKIPLLGPLFMGTKLKQAAHEVKVFNSIPISGRLTLSDSRLLHIRPRGRTRSPMRSNASTRKRR